ANGAFSRLGGDRREVAHKVIHIGGGLSALRCRLHDNGGCTNLAALRRQGHNRASKNTLPAERTRLFSIIQAAGWPIWPLLLCSIAAMALVIERFSSLRTPKVAPPTLVDEVMSVTRASLPSADVVNKLEQNSVRSEERRVGK